MTEKPQRPPTVDEWAETLMSEFDWHPVDDPEATADPRAEAVEAMRELLRRQPSGFRYAPMTLLDPKTYEAAHHWHTADDSLTFYVKGPVGTGKTTTLAAVATRSAQVILAIKRAGVPVEWWSVAEFLDALRPSQDNAARAAAVWRRARECRLLVLDDLAHVRPTEWAAERMWMLLDWRVSRGLQQLVSTNAAWRDLEACWGPGTMDRLRMGAVQVVLEGKSRRRMLENPA